MLRKGLISIVILAPLAPRLLLKSTDKVNFLLFFLRNGIGKGNRFQRFLEVLTFFINLLKIAQQQAYAPQQQAYAPQQPVFVQPVAYAPQPQVVEYAKAEPVQEPEPVYEKEPEPVHEIGDYQQAEEEPESGKMNDPNMPATYDF